MDLATPVLKHLATQYPQPLHADRYTLPSQTFSDSSPTGYSDGLPGTICQLLPQNAANPDGPSPNDSVPVPAAYSQSSDC